MLPAPSGRLEKGNTVSTFFCGMAQCLQPLTPGLRNDLELRSDENCSLPAQTQTHRHTHSHLITRVHTTTAFFTKLKKHSLRLGLANTHTQSSQC